MEGGLFFPSHLHLWNFLPLMQCQFMETKQTNKQTNKPRTLQFDFMAMATVECQSFSFVSCWMLEIVMAIWHQMHQLWTVKLHCSQTSLSPLCTSFLLALACKSSWNNLYQTSLNSIIITTPKYSSFLNFICFMSLTLLSLCWILWTQEILCPAICRYFKCLLSFFIILHNSMLYSRTDNTQHYKRVYSHIFLVYYIFHLNEAVLGQLFILIFIA